MHVGWPTRQRPRLADGALVRCYGRRFRNALRCSGLLGDGHIHCDGLCRGNAAAAGRNGEGEAAPRITTARSLCGTVGTAAHASATGAAEAHDDQAERCQRDLPSLSPSERKENSGESESGREGPQSVSPGIVGELSIDIQGQGYVRRMHTVWSDLRLAEAAGHMGRQGATRELYGLGEAAERKDTECRSPRLSRIDCHGRRSSLDRVVHDGDDEGASGGVGGRNDGVAGIPSDEVVRAA